MLTRRLLLQFGGVAALGAVVKGAKGQDGPAVHAGPGPAPTIAPALAVGSANGLRAMVKAGEMLRTGADPLDAAVEGVRIIEDDPQDQSVGLGGLPNEEGIVELDASVMHGPTHRAAGVAALRGIKNPAAVAREVARRTDHVLLVGEGALKFARRMGFKEEDLLTEESRREWLKWRSELSREDDWLQDDEFDIPTVPTKGDAKRSARPAMFTTGTVHCSTRTPGGDLAGTTSTSGLSWKLPGRVGDSPIIGAGLYTDNAVGSAGATGRGEAVIQVCGARSIVARMEAGDTPLEACLKVLKMIADRTRAKRLLDASGKPNFGVTLYALRKDGAYGSASMWSGAKFAVCDAGGGRVLDAGALFEKKS